MSNTDHNKTPLFLRYWQPIAFLIGVVAAFAYLQANVKQLNADYSSQQQTIMTYAASQGSVEVKLSQIETDIQWIKTTLQKQGGTLNQ